MCHLVWQQAESQPTHQSHPWRPRGSDRPCQKQGKAVAFGAVACCLCLFNAVLFFAFNFNYILWKKD